MTLILELPDNTKAALKAKAQANSVSTEQYVQRIVVHDLAEAIPATNAPRRHISEVIRERFSKIPAEDWSDVPTDGASEHDHYIYGLHSRPRALPRSARQKVQPD